MVDVIVGTLAILGAVLMLLAGVGTLSFPDLYSRMHAATKAPTLGIALICIAGAIALETARGRILLAAVLVFVTAPCAAHVVGRAAYRAEGIEMRLDGADDLQAFIDQLEDDT